LTRVRFSGHIPDFNLISNLSENGSSLLHRSSSYLKLAYLFLVVIAATSLQEIEYLVILFILTLMVYKLGNLPFNLLWRWYLIPISFVLAVSFLFVFNEPGTPVAAMDLPFQVRIQLTYEGLILLSKLILRTLSVVTYSFAFIMTTKYAQLGYIANSLLPAPLNTVFLLSYRFSFVMLGEITLLLKALSSRGGDLVRGIMTQTRIFGGIFAVAFVHSFDRAERIAKAMEARGFEGRINTCSAPESPSPLGILTIIFATIFLVLGVLLR